MTYRKTLVSFIAWFLITLGTLTGCSQFFSAEPPSSPPPSVQPTAIASKTPSPQASGELTVAAAASLKEALTEIAPLYKSAYPQTSVRSNFGSSGALQQQIENGAPVDIFISAATKQMDELQKKNLILPDTRQNLLGNQLVLVVPANSTTISDLNNLTSDQIERIAIGEPRSVPAGQYGQQALKNLGILDKIQPKFVLGNNVRQVLQFVESGNAQAGIVYATDAKTSTKVKVVQVLDQKLHDPIVYPIAVLKRSGNADTAKSFTQFLASSPAKAVFQKYGFDTL